MHHTSCKYVQKVCWAVAQNSVGLYLLPHVLQGSTWMMHSAPWSSTESATGTASSHTGPSRSASIESWCSHSAQALAVDPARSMGDHLGSS